MPAPITVPPTRLVVLSRSQRVAAEATLGTGCLFIVQRLRPALRPDLAIIPKVVLAAGAALVPALLVDAHPAVLVVLSSIAYVAVLVALRGIPPELVNALRGRDPEPQP